MQFDFFNNKHVIVTGGASGIGKAITIELLNSGSFVYVLDYNPTGIEQLKKELSHSKLQVFTCDISKIESITHIKNILDDQKISIDGVIANAGVGGLNPADQFSLEIHKRTIEINCIGIANTIMPFVPSMIANNFGFIAGVSSMAAFRGLPNAASYSSSKSQQRIFLESLRVDLKKYGISVTSIHPGFVKTQMTNHDDFDMPFMIDPQDAAKRIISAIQNRKAMALFPYQMKIITFLNRLLPNFIYDLIIPIIGKTKIKAKAKML